MASMLRLIIIVFVTCFPLNVFIARIAFVSLITTITPNVGHRVARTDFAIVPGHAAITLIITVVAGDFTDTTLVVVILFLVISWFRASSNLTVFPNFGSFGALDFGTLDEFEVLFSGWRRGRYNDGCSRCFLNDDLLRLLANDDRLRGIWTREVLDLSRITLEVITAIKVSLIAIITFDTAWFWGPLSFNNTNLSIAALNLRRLWSPLTTNDYPIFFKATTVSLRAKVRPTVDATASAPTTDDSDPLLPLFLFTGDSVGLAGHIGSLAGFSSKKLRGPVVVIPLAEVVTTAVTRSVDDPRLPRLSDPRHIDDYENVKVIKCWDEEKCSAW
jgi:hypothetical protein